MYSPKPGIVGPCVKTVKMFLLGTGQSLDNTAQRNAQDKNIPLRFNYIFTVPIHKN